MKCCEFRMLYSSWCVAMISRTRCLCSDLSEKRGAQPRILRTKATAYLSRHINNLHCIVLASVLDHFAESVFDGGIIAVYKHTVHKSDGERRFAWATGSAHSSYSLHEQHHLPTDRLPTSAIFRCLGAGMVALNAGVASTWVSTSGFPGGNGNLS